MSGPPVAHLQTADDRERASWQGLAEISERMPKGWSLAGGSLVRLHIAERGGTGGRSTRDIDLILDVRAEPRSTDRIVQVLKEIGFAPDGLNPAGHDHRWVRDGAQIDILAPDFLGPRLEWKHPGLGKLLATRGAQFGLDRTETVRVAVDDLEFSVRRPNLIGALYEKCSALLILMDSDKARHLGDIALLPELVAQSPRDRRELLALNPKQLKRVRSGLVRAREGGDLGAHSVTRLQGLERLVSTQIPR